MFIIYYVNVQLPIETFNVLGDDLGAFSGIQGKIPTADTIQGIVAPWCEVVLMLFLFLCFSCVKQWPVCLCEALKFESSQPSELGQ